MTAGVFRQLDWKGATRQLTAVKDDFKYSESQIYADVFIQKVNMMATVQEVFIANCKGYKFAKSKLARFTIANISEKEITLTKPDGKTPMKMTWVKFYQQFHGNLNELIVKFIEKGKNVCKLADGKRLSLQPWADAMMGAALEERRQGASRLPEPREGGLPGHAVRRCSRGMTFKERTMAQ